MKNLVKVENVRLEKNNYKYDHHKTFTNIIKLVFPNYEEKPIDNVNFHPITEGGWFPENSPLVGIELRTSNTSWGRDTVKRKIFIKDGMIDLDAIKTKFEELKAVAVQKQNDKDKQNAYGLECRKFYEKVSQSIGFTDDWGKEKARIISLSPTTVRIWGNVNSSQLMKLEKLMDFKKTIEVSFDVGEDKIAEIYKIISENGEA